MFIAYRIHTFNTTVTIAGKIIKLLLSKNKKFLSYIDTKIIAKMEFAFPHCGLSPLYLTFLGSSQLPVSVSFPGALEASLH